MKDVKDHIFNVLRPDSLTFWNLSFIIPFDILRNTVVDMGEYDVYTKLINSTYHDNAVFWLFGQLVRHTDPSILFEDFRR
jgi:hypothetical protein